MPTSLMLPLSLNSNRNFQAFFKAIEDKSAQNSLLNDSTIDPGVKEVISLANDGQFLTMAENLVNEMHSLKASRTSWPGSFSTYRANIENSDPDKISNDAQAIRAYVQNKYPQGVKLLTEYGRLAQPSHLIADDTVGAWTNVAAYAEALVNGAVYANVAVATNLVIAAAVAAVIGAAVMVP